MSHYTVAVFHREGQDVDELLAPYNEDLRVEPYIVYTREQAIQYAKDHWKAEHIEGKSDQEIWDMMAEGYESDSDGNLYSDYNPDSKWDWYQTGGRWGGLLRLKPEARADYGDAETVDEAYVCDIDFSPDPDEYESAIRFWDVVVGGEQKREGEDFFTIYSPEYYKEYYGSRENYAKAMADFTTFAVVTPDGEWHEPGRMGWFGCSSATPDSTKAWNNRYREQFIDAADPEWVLTVVDCHI